MDCLLLLLSLKNTVDENATIKSAFNQIQTYKATIPALFIYNEVAIISDGLEARAGSISAGFDRFMAWKSIDGEKEASRLMGQIEEIFEKILSNKEFGDIVKNILLKSVYNKLSLK
jgi:type I restriction enzyme R subunit